MYGCMTHRTTSGVMAPLIANLSFKDGVFFSRYKADRVTLLLKKPSLSLLGPANYRPISNVCMFPKILVKLYLLGIQPHVTKSANNCKFQSAYPKTS